MPSEEDRPATLSAALADTQVKEGPEEPPAAPADRVQWTRSDAVVGLPDDAAYRLARELDEKYVRGLGWLCLVCAAAYPLFAIAEAVSLLGGIGPVRLLGWVIAGRLGMAGIFAASAALLLRWPLPSPAVRAMDLVTQCLSAAHLGWLAGISDPGGEALFLSALGMQFFLRCLFVPGSPRWAAVVTLTAWPVMMLAFVLSSAPERVRHGAALWVWLGAIQTMLLVMWTMAMVGAVLVGRLRQQEVETRSKGRYRIQSLLASGGFGDVYRGWDAFLEANCAIKVLHRRGEYAQDTIRRFETEVRATSRLSSPHIVRVYDYGCTRDGHLYYVMEILEGRDLACVVADEGPLDVRRTLLLMTQAAEALQSAHQAGILHRDIKPANLFVLGQAPAEHLKVLDFGLARSLVEDGGFRSAAGAMVGTPGFIAPEHVKGERIDERADIYAVGAVMYYLLTGEEVFGGPTPMAVLARHVFESPRPPRGLRQELPQAVEDILLRCLEKEPARRFPSMGALRDALVAVTAAGG